MPTENHGARAVPEREPSKDSRRPTPPSAPSSPPILADGLESPRSSHC
jgi:hypothetical protein